ncbi:MAG: fumarylacetoacetate hydrolase family protein [Flavobacteriia bacterium]|nr:fumarylacetoacetate hydrolase family protein [Flavobacteriia bacterium]OJX34796.1 MAG: 2-hydroxyhepta-2,4-diene-1,7-dioate isomerase [Flavobacteriia bacterium 40-80]
MKIICIGRNYADHAKELNNPLPKAPMFFLKPDTALLIDNDPFYIPEFSNDIHYECELVFKINRVGKNIAEKFAPKYYAEIGLGVDFTARDLQQQCKEQGTPWEIAKGFDNSAVISKFIPLESLNNKENIEFRLDLNGQTVQTGKSENMIFNVNQLIAYISQFITLKTGDLIFTGTPAGVGAVKIGDRLQGYLEDRLMYDFEIK